MAADLAVSAPAAAPKSLAQQMQEDLAPAPTAAKKYDPTEGMSTTDKVLAGIGMGMTRAARGVGQALGMVSQADIDEAHRLEAPLSQTRAGSIGNVVGNTAALAPAMFLPGANTYVGATTLGGLLGGLTTEGGAQERGMSALGGAAGGFVGKGLGNVLGYGAGKLSDLLTTRGASQQAANQARDAAINAARAAGYKLPPQETNPGMVNAALEGLSGKIKTSQAASQFNQDVTNRLVKTELGLPHDQPITVDALKSLRAQAGQAYAAVAQTGTVTPSANYTSALDAILAPFKKSSSSFPNGKINPVVGEIEALKTPQFDAAAGVQKISELRDAADAAFRAGAKGDGRAYKSAAEALENALDEHMQNIGAAPGMLDAYRTARQTIAKTYSVESALNPTTGNVNAAKLAGQLQRGKPLSGDIKTVAQVGQAFPKATQTLTQNYNPMSPLDYVVGLAGAMHNPWEAALVFGRPVVRSGLLSEPVQNLNATLGQQYGPGIVSGAALNGAQSLPLKRLLQLGGTEAGIQQSLR